MDQEEMYDFDTPVERRDTASLKWEKYKGRDIIPGRHQRPEEADRLRGVRLCHCAG
jgi:hypothetical protein